MSCTKFADSIKSEAEFILSHAAIAVYNENLSSSIVKILSGQWAYIYNTDITKKAQ